MPKQKLFDEDSEDEVALVTENEYAKKYDKWRQKEELHKLEQKYGSKALNSDASSSSDSEDESDEPPEISEETEAQFLKTLALLKTKDPRIYDPQFKLFNETEKKEPEQEQKSKTLTFADSDDDDEDDGNIFSIEKKAEIAETDKKPQQKPDKQGKLKDYLTGKAEHIDDEVEKDLAPLKALWSDPKLNEGEAFLRDYILNKRYLDDGDVGEAEDKIRDDEELEADEARVEEQGKFERAYNFRFEEPDQEYLKRFPRTMNYIRPKDDKRSRKRAEVRTRKEEEKKKKIEEIARLKALKLQEIREKMQRIREVTGNEELAFKEDDLDSEFDPEEHDRRMREIFDDQYYGHADEEKPVFPDLDEELEIENWEDYEPGGEVEGNQNGEELLHCEDEEFNMDADYDPKTARQNLIEEMKRALTGKKPRNRKKKSKLAQLLASEKPKFIPTDAQKTYDQYMEEYYKMDCEDVIGGDLPTRFKYREVVPNDFGLTVEEILLADDKELTQWVPLKKILKHRPDHVEKGEAKTYAQKAADPRLKRKMLPSLFKDLPEEPEIVVPVEEATKKKKKKKKKNKQKTTDDSNTQNNIDNTETDHRTTEDSNEDTVNSENVASKPNGDVKQKKKKKRKSNNNVEDTEVQIESNEQLEDLNIQNCDVSQKKKKKKDKTVTEQFTVETIESTEVNEEETLGDQNVVLKKKKKDRTGSESFMVEDVENTEASNEQSIQESSGSVKKKKKNKQKATNFIVNETGEATKKDNSSNVNGQNKVNLKRKASSEAQQPANKKKKFNKGKGNNKKFNQKDKFKKKNVDQSDNPLSKLSDERLKAYGLNPKKYRGFLKYKKY